jgi:hypothetical protein
VAGARPGEEGKRRTEERGKEEREEEKEKKGKKRKKEEEKEGKEKEKRRKKMEKGKEKGLEIRKIAREIRGKRFCGVFRIPGVGVIFGTAVMARWTGRRDRGMCGIPGAVANHGAGVACVGAGPSAGGAGGIRGTRVEGERGRWRPGFRREKLSSAEKFGNTCDLLGYLLGAKNAGVTNLPPLK